MIIEKYIVIKDKKIIGCFETSQGRDGIVKSIGNTEYDSIQQVNIEGDHKIETNIDEYDKNHKFHPVSKRVKDGFVKLPPGHKLDGENIVSMNLQEKIEAGLLKIDPLMKAVENNIILKTDAELILEGIKTKKQIDEEKAIIEEEKLIASEMRKLAIERLGKKLKIITK